MKKFLKNAFSNIQKILFRPLQGLTFSMYLSLKHWKEYARKDSLDFI